MKCPVVPAAAAVAAQLFQIKKSEKPFSLINATGKK